MSWLQVEPRSWREHRDCIGKECFAQIFKSAQYLKLPPDFNTITVLWRSGKTSEWISAVNLCAFCFVFIFICVCGGGEMRSCGVQERVLGSLQLEWQAVVDHLTWCWEPNSSPTCEVLRKIPLNSPSVKSDRGLIFQTCNLSELEFLPL